MSNRTNTYVAVVAILAVFAAGVLFIVAPDLTQTTIAAVVLLSALALIAEAMSVVLSRSVHGSIAFIPYLASIVIAPSWLALVGVSLVRLLADRRRAPVKVVFNVAQHALTFALTALLYRSLGGIALIALPAKSLLEISRQVGLQAMVAIMFSLALNSFLVSGVIATNAQKPLRLVWRETYLSTIGLDVLATPVIFIFAWVYVAFGAIAAATIWVPILGLRQFHKANLELERTNRELLELMVKSIEARDPYTSGHSRRVHLYSLSIARGLGLPEKLIERIGRAALLHDVGKIHEKYAPILRNPKSLTADEWIVMKEHPVDGANLVSTVSGLSELVGPIRGHHENWDGTGYPDGIAGEAIPLESRIIMFADTIDAMTSERPYRPGLSEEQVRSEIVRARGRQFDPALTDRVLAASVWHLLFPQRAASRSPALSLLSKAEKVATRA